MTNEELAEIEKRANAATPGPWFQNHRSWHKNEADPLDEPRDISGAQAGGPLHPSFIDDSKAYADSLFIAHARTDIPLLLAEVQRLQNINEKLIREVDYWRSAGSFGGT